MKLQDIQEARHHSATIIPYVRKTTQEVEQLIKDFYSNKGSQEEIGRTVEDMDPEQIIRDMDQVYDRAGVGDYEIDGEYYWDIKEVERPDSSLPSSRRISIKIQAVLDLSYDRKSKPMFVVFWS